MSKQKMYSAEHKRGAVEMVRNSNVSARQIAQELGINPNMLGRWCRELAKVKKERDFLKEAAAFFAKEPK